MNNEVSLHDDIVCYMNGSKQGNTGSTGAGIFNSTKGEELVLPLGKVTTVYQAEVYAILLCVSELQQEVNQSDSRGALKAIRANKITLRLVSETVDDLQVLSLQCKTFVGSGTLQH